MSVISRDGLNWPEPVVHRSKPVCYQWLGAGLKPARTVVPANHNIGRKIFRPYGNFTRDEHCYPATQKAAARYRRQWSDLAARSDGRRIRAGH